jgi:hypothetical protein
MSEDGVARHPYCQGWRMRQLLLLAVIGQYNTHLPDIPFFILDSFDDALFGINGWLLCSPWGRWKWRLWPKERWQK